VFLLIMVHPCGNVPMGVGAPLNGEFNRGGGFVVMSSVGLERQPNWQASLRHELGHAFGLRHVDAYGYSMETSPSIMSYNPDHATDGFNPSMTPGELIPEDLRALALNQRVFPGLEFRAASDAPVAYGLHPLAPLAPGSFLDESPWGAMDSYQLYWDGELQGTRSTYNRSEALANLQWNVAEYPSKQVTATWLGDSLHPDSQGYELFLDGARAGYEPN